MNYNLTTSPHFKNIDNVPRIMWDVVIALVPAIIGAVWFFGFSALWIIASAILGCALTEFTFTKLSKKPITITNGSVFITGILLAFNLPGNIPLILPFIGGVFAIGIAKLPFGGLGNNPLNPALAARAFMMASWPVHMTTDWTATRLGVMAGTKIDAFSGATPLGALKQARLIFSDPTMADKVDQARQALEDFYYSSGAIKNLFLGNVSGCIGETSVILLLLGAAYLFLRKVLEWRIPASFIITVAALSFILGDPDGTKFSIYAMMFHLFSGGLILGAFFMATDMVTSPVTKNGRIYFGIGCGLLTVLIRYWGGYPEGVSYSILLMNVATPMIDRLAKPKVFGLATMKKQAKGVAA
jgi:Na+-translocating ferredoxin:NAD+ oxidoreductase subunit D